MRKATILLTMALAATAACKKTGENQYQVVTPGDVDVKVTPDTHTVRTPDVDIVKDTATVVTPKVQVKKDTSHVTIPKVRVRKP
jgi:hypothetical protein